MHIKNSETVTEKPVKKKKKTKKTDTTELEGQENLPYSIPNGSLNLN